MPWDKKIVIKFDDPGKIICVRAFIVVEWQHFPENFGVVTEKVTIL